MVKHTLRRKSTKTSATRKHRRHRTYKRRSQKGGVLAGVLKAAKTALLPFLMYKAQKRAQIRNRRSMLRKTQRRR